MGTFFAAKDAPDKECWWLHRVIECAEHQLTTRIYGTQTPHLRTAKFVPLFVDTKDNTIRLSQHGSPLITPWKQVFATSSLPILVLAHRLVVSTSTHKLSRSSVAVLESLRGNATHAIVRKDMSEFL